MSLVEEEDAAEGAAERARPDLAGPAPDERGPGRRGVRASNVGRVTNGAPGGSVPATEWMAVTSSAACSSSGGKSRATPRELARPGRVGQ
jgi:hypothetical protein